MPQLQAVQDHWEGRGFTVIGISVDQQGPEIVERFVAHPTRRSWRIG